MKHRILITAVIGFTTMLFGCSNTDNTNNTQDNNANTQEMHYKNNNDQTHEKYRELSIGEKGGYPQSDLSGTNASNGHSGNYTDIFTNDESKKIYNHIMKQKEIKQAQVASLDDRVIIAVMLADHSNHYIRDKIEKEVKEIVPNKQVVVYTDDTKWDRMKNLKAKLGPANTGEKVKDELKKLFNMDDR